MSNGTATPPAGGTVTSDPLFAAVIGKFPPVGANFDDDDRVSLIGLLIESINLIYHQSQQTIAVSTVPAPAPDGSASATTPPAGTSTGSTPAAGAAPSTGL